MSRDYPRPDDGLLQFARKVSTLDFDGLRDFLAGDLGDDVKAYLDLAGLYEFLSSQWEASIGDGDYSSAAFGSILLERLGELREATTPVRNVLRSDTANGLGRGKA